MKKYKTLDAAVQRIEELEEENSKLKEELEYYKKRKASGRQKHNAKWTAIYNDFVICHEKGMSMIEIAERNGLSERSMYRYKAYYDKICNDDKKQKKQLINAALGSSSQSRDFDWVPV